MSQPPKFSFQSLANNNLVVFGFLWAIAFVLYLPTIHAGFVGDFPYWIDGLKNDSLWDYINIKNSFTLYHTEQLSVYVLYKLSGIHPWPWHIVFITLHALNGALLFKLFSTLLIDSGITNARYLALVSVCLFIICPHASEAVVWKCVNHFLLVPAIMFLILVMVQKFHTTQKKWYALMTGLLFAYICFSLEFFYLTPVFVLILICYYHFVLGVDKRIFKQALVLFFVPITSLLILYFTVLRIYSHTFISHYGGLSVHSIYYYLDKPLKYLFHVVFLGRFFPNNIRNSVYNFTEIKAVIIIIYALILMFWGYVLLNFKKVTMRVKLVALVSAYLFATYMFMSPLIFADSLLVYFDRYTYLSNGFTYFLLVLLISFIPSRVAQIVLFVGYALVNVRFTEKVNKYWKQSAGVIDHLLHQMPDPGNKTVLFLNTPDDLNGVPMIAAEPEGRYKTMINSLTPRPVPNKIYDVLAYNMSNEHDGAHVTIVNDSVMHVTLNQWGTWWLFGMLGAQSYSNSDFSVNVVDQGHWYELTLRHPADQYLLLYQVGYELKVVDWNKKNIDQY